MNAGKNISSGIQGIVWKHDVEPMPVDILIDSANEVLVGPRFEGMTLTDITA